MYELKLINGEEIYFEEGRHKLYTGKIEYEDCDGQAVEGKKEGEWLFYNEDGSLSKKEVYKNNILCEDILEYYSEGRYGKILIDEKGNRIKKVEYNKFNIKEKEEGCNEEWYKNFYEDGNLKSYSKSLRDGSFLYEKYYENGQIEEKKKWSGFNCHTILYYENGQLKKEFKEIGQDYIVGEVKSYFEDGKVQEVNKKLSLDNQDEKFEILKYNQNGDIIEEGIRERGIETYLKIKTKSGYKRKRVVFDFVLEEEFNTKNILQKRKINFQYNSNLLGVEKGKIDLLYYEKYFNLSTLEKMLGYKKNFDANLLTKKEDFFKYDIREIYYLKEFIDLKDKLEKVYLRTNLRSYLVEFLKCQKDFLGYVLCVISPRKKDEFVEIFGESLNTILEIFEKYNLLNEMLDNLIENKNQERKNKQQNVFDSISSLGRIIADSYHDKIMEKHRSNGQNQIEKEVWKILRENQDLFLYRIEKTYRWAFYISNDLETFETKQVFKLDNWISIGLEYLKNKQNPLCFLRLLRVLFNNHPIVLIFLEIYKKSGIINKEEIESYGFKMEDFNEIQYFEISRINTLDKTVEEEKRETDFIFNFKNQKHNQEFFESKEIEKLNKMRYMLDVILGEQKNDNLKLSFWEKEMLSVLKDEKELNNMCLTIKDEAQKTENIDYQKIQKIITFINNIKQHEFYNYILRTLPRLKDLQKTYSENEKFIMKVKNYLRQKEIEKIEYEENRSERKKLIEQALKLSVEKRKNGKFLAILILGISIWYGTYGDLIQEYIIPKIAEWKFLLKNLTVIYGGIYLVSYYFLGIILSSILGRLYFNSIIKKSSLDNEEKKYLREIRN
ncbi:hypothetical protein [Cetobacterium sp. 2G large]|uniref:hypothetical protein n=1 Tax=Cetobacterium sp. 2G large TaxID=2759680 RepID=UPI00163C6E85|nr:hypothetical protein [Cetobacterium sp. 2G large]MBC2854705.1 hypothetical protein [Cetobacterium sp. 2G large]